MRNWILLIAISLLVCFATATHDPEAHCPYEDCEECASYWEGDDDCTPFFERNEISCGSSYTANGTFLWSTYTSECVPAPITSLLVLYAKASLPFLLIIALVCLCLIVRDKGLQHYRKGLRVPAEDTVVMMSAYPTWMVRATTFVFGLFTCGIVYPAMVVRMIHNFYDDFWLGGLQGEFHGTETDYCANVCCWNCLLTGLSCGLWTCCGYAQSRFDTWVDRNTSIRGQPHMRGEEWVYLWRSRPSWIRVFATNCLTALTCGLILPAIFINNATHVAVQVAFGPKRLSLTTNTEQYVSLVWIPRMILGCVSCGVYQACGFEEAASRVFVDNHLQPFQPVDQPEYAPPARVMTPYESGHPTFL